MIYPILTYSRDSGDFTYSLNELHKHGLKAIRLIYKGKSEEEFNSRIKEIQEKISANKLGIDILIDLPGSKPIVGDLPNGLNVLTGKEYQLLSHDSESLPTAIPTSGFFCHESFSKLTFGDIISIADDELNLMVKEVQENLVLCEALNSFHLSSNRSISVKNKPFSFEANSDKDLLFVQNMKQNAGNVRILVSFTKNAGDIRKLKSLQPQIDFIPKIETILDDAALLEIMQECQTILLGRGDLSTSSQPKEIFSFQKRLIDLCFAQKKELIIGTGLLSGIGDNKPPSISDVMDYGYLRSMGIQAFLISGSNAHKKPLETLKFMSEFQ
jgi:pyruvate kinase